MEKAGYLLVYVSNERQSNTPVYFDDLEVTLSTGKIDQYHEYYPFGQETSASWQRPGSRANEFSYNAGSEYSLATKWLETYYRPYDPALGRFTGVDVLADNFSSLTPYQYGFNDPVYWNDPVGDSPAGWSYVQQMYGNEFGPMFLTPGEYDRQFSHGYSSNWMNT